MRFTPEGIERGCALTAYLLFCCGAGALMGGGMPLLVSRLYGHVPEMMLLGCWLLVCGYVPFLLAAEQVPTRIARRFGW